MSGALFALFGHYLKNGFNSPINGEQFLLDILFFGSIMVVFRFIQEWVSARKRTDSA